MMNSKCDYKHMAVPLGLMFALLYFVFYFWSYTVTEPAVKELHINLLKLVFFWFNGLNGISFLLGLIQSFVWGLIVAALFYFGYRHCPCDDCACETSANR